MRRYLGPTLGVFVLLAVGAGLVRMRSAESAARPSMGVAYAGGLGGPGLTGGGSSGGSSPSYTGDVTARFFYASADAGTVLNLKDFTKICWSTNGTDTNKACLSASQGASVAQTVFDGSGGAGGGNYVRSNSGFYVGSSGECAWTNQGGISCSSGSSRVSLGNSQSNIRTTFSTNTPAGGYGHIVGTSVTDASDAGTFHTVLMSWGTGVGSDVTGNIKAAITGGGMILGAIDAGASPISFSGYGTATLDFSSASAGLCSTDLTITVTGAVAGAPVDIGVPNGSVATGSMFSGWVSAANTVTVRHCCNLGSACDPASGTFSARVWNP